MRRATQRQIQPESQALPAPVGGINARDALANMPPTDCISAINCFGQTSFVQIPRNGCSIVATGLPGAVETIMAFNGQVLRKLFAVSGGNIYDITTPGAVGAPVVSGLANSRLQHALFNAGGGTVLGWVNGQDTPQWYNANGNILTLNTLVPGSGYATGSGTIPNVPLLGGTGTGAVATFTITTNVITAVTLTSSGINYSLSDTLTISPSALGGSGSGFSIKVATLSNGWANSTVSATGLDPRNLITITVFKQRCWFVEKNTMNVWYTGIQAFQGTVVLLPLGGIFKKGGTLVNMATWTIDNVSGIDDYAVFVTSEGEVAVYQGTDPAQAATWALVGIFNIGRPIGTRCYTKYASDILIITADGLTPLSKAMLTDRTQADSQLTYKILNAINADVQQFNANFGWQVIDYPLGNKLILNVPEAFNATIHQWVLNPVAKSWWRYQDWNANCWELQQDALYFGENTRVFLADVGLSDAGMAITIDCKPAFSYFGSTGSLKNFLMAQPIMQSNAAIYPQVTLNVDFNDVINPSPPFTGNTTSPWDTSPWDITPWAGDVANISIKQWQGIAGFGYAASGRISMLLSNVSAQWFATNYLYTSGGPI